MGASSVVISMLSLYCINLRYKNIPKIMLMMPVTKNSCDKLSFMTVSRIIEKMAEPTINIALKILLAPTMRER